MHVLAGHRIEFTVFAAVLALVVMLGFWAARWRRPQDMHSLEEWGLGGRAFGNWVTWFLLGGDIYTAYTLVAVPALVYGIGAVGFFAVPFAVLTTPLVYLLVTRAWSVAHVHGFVTPAEFVRARFGSRSLAGMVAVTGLVATMPYVALQLVGLSVVLATMGITGDWPLVAAFTLLAACTFRSGLRAPALMSIVKDLLLLWTVLAAMLVIAMTPRGLANAFRTAKEHFDLTPNSGDGLLLGSANHLSYATLAVGSALAMFAYPHVLTGVLAARNRATLQRNMAALPVYTIALGLIALLGYVALSKGVVPLDGDLNTVVPMLFHQVFPDWFAGIALAAIGVGALVPAAVMSIAAGNLYTRSIYREYLRPHATPAQEARVSRYASLGVKLGAVGCILLLDPQFAVDLQLIGGVIVLQTVPAVGLGLFTAWFHRRALLAGLVAGLLTGLVMLYQIPQLGADGRTVVRAHFGGSAWPLSHLGLPTDAAVYVGVLALVVNLAVAVAVTPLLRRRGVPSGPDVTHPEDYTADEGDPALHRMTELVDGDAGLPTHAR
ncbi:sodium:solute symporter [Actinoplanes sp. NPDC049548]|uniref:sodium:solute symporter family protein n=1 Tax=Actinoplanes sp. NPDC049548 TaxID=3155152 RepID=UPI00343A16E5